MIKRIAIIAVAAASLYSTIPASAQEVGVGIGPGGVTVGAVGRDRYRDNDRDYYRDREYRRDRNETVIIKRDRDRDYDRDRRPVVIERY